VRDLVHVPRPPVSTIRPIWSNGRILYQPGTVVKTSARDAPPPYSADSCAAKLGAGAGLRKTCHGVYNYE
jgi:hypothetical protein